MSENQQVTQPAPETGRSVMEEKFAKMRKDFSAEINEGVHLLRDIKQLIRAKIVFLSLRQRLLEENHTLLDNHNKFAKKFRELKSVKILESMQSMQLRMNEREKDKYLDGTPELSKLKGAMDVIQNQSNFYSESIKTVDQVLFNLKVRMDIEKMLGGE